MGAAMVDTTVARGARDGPLAGVVVADFSRVLAGPIAQCCWRTLART